MAVGAGVGILVGDTISVGVVDSDEVHEVIKRTKET
jgi:hypothetical protein